MCLTIVESGFSMRVRDRGFAACKLVAMGTLKVAENDRRLPGVPQPARGWMLL